MGLDPTLAQGVIKDDMTQQRLQNQEQRAQENAIRQGEAAVRAKEQHDMAKARFEYEQKNQAAAKEEAANAAKAISVHNKSPEALDRFIETVPPEQQMSVRAAVAEWQQHQASIAKYNEEAKQAEPFSIETVASMAKTPGMEVAIEAYENMKDQYPKAAKRILIKQWEAARSSEMIENRAKPDIERKPLTEAEIKNARDLVDSHYPDTWWGFDTEERDYKPAIAKRVAERYRERGWEPTPEALDQIYKEVQAGIGINEATAQGIPTITTQAEYDALEKGATFIDSEDGKTYVK